MSSTGTCVDAICSSYCCTSHYRLYNKKKWRIEKHYFLIIIAIGIIGNAISIVAQETSTMLSTAQMGAIITSSTPAFMVIFALKERMTLRKGISVCLATIGVFLIVGIGDVNMSGTLGGIALLIAALTWHSRLYL